MSSHIDTHRLMFLGRFICSSEVDLLHKDIFTNSVAEYLIYIYIESKCISAKLYIAWIFPSQNIGKDTVKYSITE